MEEILKYCIKVNGERACHPVFGWFSEKPLEPCLDMAGKYETNNGVVAFVAKDGSYYVTPFYSKVGENLSKLGFTRGNLYVPFSNGDIPMDKELAEKWKALCEVERRETEVRCEQEKRERYAKMANEKGLDVLPEDVYQLSLEIPDDGLETIWWGQERSKTQPIYEWQVQDCMGTYCQNNGKVSFVDANGKMFVTPFWYEVGVMLRQAGYREGSLYVPLSNGEKIVDPDMNTRWEAICSEERNQTYVGQKQNSSGSSSFKK